MNYPGDKHQQRTLGLFLVCQVWIIHLPQSLWKMRRRLRCRYPLVPERQEARGGLDGCICNGVLSLRRDRDLDVIEATQTAYTDQPRR